MDEAQQYARNLAVALPSVMVYIAISPPVVFWAVARGYFGFSVEQALVEVVRGWAAQGVWTAVVGWGFWWPAWVLGGVVMGSGVWSSSRTTQ